jgi:hypothetical protein
MPGVCQPTLLIDFGLLISDFGFKTSARYAMQSAIKNHQSAIWLARAALLVVLIANLSAAIPFLVSPADYVGGFELSGIAGEAAVRGFGLLFLMWAVPFIPAIIHPVRYRVAFVCVLAMQVIGLAGELLMLLGLPAGHDMLRATGLRFIAFDGVGLVLLLIAYRLSRMADGR